MDNFLQEEVGSLWMELDNKQKIIDHLISLLNSVTKKRDETNFFCKSFQVKTTSEKANVINETISSNGFLIVLNKNQLKMVKEKLAAAPSDTSRKQNIENFQNCNTASDDVNNQCKKAIYDLKCNNRSKKKSIKPS